MSAVMSQSNQCHSRAIIEFGSKFTGLCILCAHAAVALARPQWEADPGKVAWVPVGAPFIFECPPVKNPGSVRDFVVTWTRDQTIWLKVENGRIKVRNTQFHDFTPRRINDKHVLSAMALGHRYEFTYDELRGQFRMSIDSVAVSDAAIWRCLVELHTVDDEWVTVSDYRQLNVGGVSGNRNQAHQGRRLPQPTVTYKHAPVAANVNSGDRPLSDMVVFERVNYKPQGHSQSIPNASPQNGLHHNSPPQDNLRHYTAVGSRNRGTQPNGAGRTVIDFCVILNGILIIFVLWLNCGYDLVGL